MNSSDDPYTIKFLAANGQLLLVEAVNNQKIAFCISPVYDSEPDLSFTLDISDQNFDHIRGTELLVGMLQELISNGKKVERNYYLAKKEDIQKQITGLREQADRLEDMLNSKLGLASIEYNLVYKTNESENE